MGASSLIGSEVPETCSVISSKGFARCVRSSVYEAFAATEKTEGDYSEKQMCQNSRNICTRYTINLSPA
jgi:hypothetical protein